MTDHIRKFSEDMVAREEENGLKSVSSKAEKFRMLAQNRTNNALVAISRVANLSNRQLYEYEDAQVRKIIKALKDAVSEVENRFSSPKGKSDARFTL